MPTSRFVTPSSRFALLTLLALVAVASAQTEEPKSEPAEIQAIGGHSVRGHISGDGRFVAFDSYAKNLIPGSENEHEIIHVFVHDRHSGITKAASLAPDGTPGNGNSAVAALSADGRLVAFQSAASNLVAGDTNGFGDIFVREIVTGATTRVSVATGGAQASGPATCRRVPW